MSSAVPVTNVVFAGLGGLGVLRASDILAEAAFLAGHDVKKSEIHGMSQRGGSVTSDVRFGARVHSPMVTPGETHYLLVLHPSQVPVVRHYLAPGGVLITTDVLFPPEAGPESLDAREGDPVNARNFNVALLGLLSTWLEIGTAHWETAIRRSLPAKVHAVNTEVFSLGRTLREAHAVHCNDEGGPAA